MTIDNVQDVAPRKQYTAGAAQTVFAVPFAFFADADLVVYVNDVLKTLATDYTVAGAGDDNGGDVTFLTPLTGGEIVTIYRDIAIERTSDFQQSGPWSSAALNAELGRMTMVEQQLESAILRCLRISPLETVPDSALELAPLSSWLGKYVTIGASGLPTPAALVAGTITGPIVQQFMSEWLDFGHVPTRVSNTQFSVPTDLTAVYTVGRRVRIIGATTAYGTINASAFAAVTTVTVAWDSGTTPTSPVAVALGILSAVNTSLPANAAAYSTGTFTPAWSGFSSAPTGDMSYEVVGRRVDMVWTGGQGTSNATFMSIGNLPPPLRPTVGSITRLGSTVVIDNGAAAAGAFLFSGSSTLEFQKGTAPPSSSGFTNTGTKGLDRGLCLSYLLS